jgi:cytoskeletal protein CcmA (bactofilin family)
LGFLKKTDSTKEEMESIMNVDNNTSQPSYKRKEKTVSLKIDDITTILGKGSEFDGKLNFEGTLRIEGKFSGEIKSDAVLVVDEGADVKAEIDVGTIVIKGQVNGNIRAKQSVEIQQPGKMYGNINTPALTIEKGVIFEGACKMESLSNKPVFTAPEKNNKPKEKNATAS